MSVFSSLSMRSFGSHGTTYYESIYTEQVGTFRLQRNIPIFINLKSIFSIECAQITLHYDMVIQVCFHDIRYMVLTHMFSLYYLNSLSSVLYCMYCIVLYCTPTISFDCIRIRPSTWRYRLARPNDDTFKYYPN